MLLQTLYIKNIAQKGRAVYSTQPIAMGTIIELSPVIVMSAAERLLLDKTLLHDYIFEWGEQKDQCAMALGFIPIYNHSYQSNCEYFMDYEAQTMFVKTIKDIAAEEELTINYNGNFDDGTKIWFEAS